MRMTKDIEQIQKENRNLEELSDKFNPNNSITLFHGDCLKLLKSIPNNSVSLVVTSPPYNIGKEYEKKSKIHEYYDWQREVIRECHRILKDDGSICWQVGNYVDNGEVIPLDLLLYPIFTELKMKMRNRIIWHFGHGLHASKRFSGRHETIMWFSKSDNYYFDLDPVRVPQKYPNKKHFKGTKKGELSCNPNGKNPSDVWDIPNVKSNHVEKTDHPCQFPVSLIERLVLSMTKENDIVLDPFAGSGTTFVASILNKRKCVGAETEEKYIKIATDRIRKSLSGEIKIREMNKPIYQPTLNKMTDLQKQIEELRNDFSEMENLTHEEEEFDLGELWKVAREALSIIKQLQEEIKQLKRGNNENEIPPYLCQECANKFEKKFKTLGYGYTIHVGVCPVCNEEKGLASASDYGLKSENEFD